MCKGYVERYFCPWCQGMTDFKEVVLEPCKQRLDTTAPRPKNRCTDKLQAMPGHAFYQTVDQSCELPECSKKQRHAAGKMGSTFEVPTELPKDHHIAQGATLKMAKHLQYEQDIPRLALP